ncbi:MAG: gliding motility protein GldM [Bacteroidales bacterium]|nr:gliding motility protein GldM [Bacteroidales bacterium]
MSGSKNCPETPRQKMIGMMYLVLTAMLALNVSADILNGFSMVDRSLGVSIGVSKSQGQNVYGRIESANAQNPTKVGPWLEKAKQVQQRCDSVYNYLEACKEGICRIADGKDIDYKPGYELEGKGNLDAAGQYVEISSGMGKANEIKKTIDDFRNFVEDIYGKDDTLKVAQYEKMFSTAKQKNSHGDQVDWINANFESMPAVAAVTMLSKYQNDVRATEAELYQHIYQQVDAGDFRVNKIEALVKAESSYVVRGGTYSAKIILAATDSTKTPKVVVNGREIENGEYKVACGSVGQFQIKGTLSLQKPDGTFVDYPINDSYTVGEPTVTISADLMNVFYAGFDNPISISVPGFATQNIIATMTGGTLTKTAKGWSAKPAKVGVPCKISVSVKDDKGKVMPMGSNEYRVKALPDPVAYIEYQDQNGNIAKYKGKGKSIGKSSLMNAPGVKAELDDADLDVRYRVLSFNVNFFDSMGNAIKESSNGNRFSDKQKSRFSKLTKGKTFFISDVKVVGPDKIERTLSAIEVNVK